MAGRACAGGEAWIFTDVGIFRRSSSTSSRRSSVGRGRGVVLWSLPRTTAQNTGTRVPMSLVPLQPVKERSNGEGARGGGGGCATAQRSRR